jgi:hypothetical protein
MPSFELQKSIEATKLDKRSGLPLENCTVPYGAIIHDLREDGSWQKFIFLGDPYRCKPAELDRALKAIGEGDSEVAEADGTAAATAPAYRMVWEEVSSSLKMRRAKVPGGWLLILLGASGNSLSFYPDSGHEWDGASLP